MEASKAAANKPTPFTGPADMEVESFYTLHLLIDLVCKIGKPAALTIKRSKAIGNLKAFLEEKDSISATFQELVFTDEKLHDDQSLLDYGIEQNSTIELVLPDVFMIKIFVKIPSLEKTIALEARPEDTVKYVKSKIQAMEGFQLDEIVLVRYGKVLQDDKTLASYDLEIESTFFLFICPKDVLSFFVRVPNKEMVELKVKTLTTIRDVKEIIGGVVDVSVMDQDLCFWGKELEDCKTLAYYKLYEKSILEIRPPSFQIFVKPWSGNTIIIDVWPFNTIGDVKGMIFERLKIPVEYQSVVFAGKRLENDRDLASYSVEKHSTLSVVLTSSTEMYELSLRRIGAKPTDSIHTLKRKIRKRNHTGVRTVVYKDLALDDDRTLSSYGITMNDNVTAVL
ncbi:polyubiquitin-B-like [Tripterygium wilfordii]|uniref:polyubiquitin-B-like n=1 Tax=Tripterygium wilfordii TaxID=458696 RepID=UPI0018F829E0|nr:polyubiquitin-B-like [Tripterygium wilfordii]